MNSFTCFRKLNSCIHTERFFNRQTAGRGNVMSFVHQNARTVRQIIFGLTVVRFDLMQRLQQQRRVERVASSVNLRNPSLFRRSIFLFDDTLKCARGIANNSAQSVIIFCICSTDHTRGLHLRLTVQQGFQRTSLQKRSIAGENQYRPLMADQIRFAHQHCVAGSFLFGLFGEHDIRMMRQCAADKIGFVSDDDDQSLCACRAGRVENIFNHQTAADRMQDFGHFGFHASALAGSKDYGNRSGHQSNFLQQRKGISDRPAIISGGLTE